MPINLSSFDSEIQSDKTPPGSAPIGPKQIRDVIVPAGRAFVRAAQDLGKLIRNHIHNDKVTDVTVKTSGSELKLSGHLKKAIPVHFEITGPISVTQNGLIDLHESSMKVVFKAEDTRLHGFVASSSCRTRLPVTRRHSPAFSLIVSVKKRTQSSS